MAQIITSNQTAEKSILDLNGRQTYLGNGYICSLNVLTIASSATETPVMYIVNPSSNSNQGASGQSLGLFLTTKKMSEASNVASATTIFKYYGNPTVTVNGSALTINSLRPALGTSSKMNAYKSPSVSDNGTFIAAFAVNYQQIDSQVLNILDPGTSTLITANSDTANTEIILELVWFEI